MNLAQLATLIAAFGSLMGVIFTYWSARQTRVTAAKSGDRASKLQELELIQKSQRDYIDDLEGRYEDLSIRVDRLEADNQTVRAERDQARDELAVQRRKNQSLEDEVERLKRSA